MPALRDGEHIPALCRLPAAAADGKWGALPSRDLFFSPLLPRFWYGAVSPMDEAGASSAAALLELEKGLAALLELEACVAHVFRASV